MWNHCFTNPNLFQNVARHLVKCLTQGVEFDAYLALRTMSYANTKTKAFPSKEPLWYLLNEVNSRSE